MPLTLLSLTKTQNESTPLLTKSSSPSPLKGYLYLLISAIIYSFISFFIHIALTRYGFSTLSSAIVRAVVPTILSVFTLSHLRPPAPSRDKICLLAARGLIGALSLFCNYEALRRIPVATLETIYASAPALTSLFCGVILGEVTTRPEIIALLASLVGVVLVAQSSSTGEHLYGPPWVGALLAVASTVFTSVACTFVRALGTRVHPVHNVLALSLGTALGCVIFSRGSDYEALILNKAGMAFTSVAVVLGFVGASLFNAGLQLCRAGPGMLIRTTKIPLTYLLGLWFLGEQCGAGAVAGAVLIVGAALAVGLSSPTGDEDDGKIESPEGIIEDRNKTERMATERSEA